MSRCHHGCRDRCDRCDYQSEMDNECTHDDPEPVCGDCAYEQSGMLHAYCDDLVDMLERIQWYGGGEHPMCIVCDCRYPLHAEDCDLAALLPPGELVNWGLCWVGIPCFAGSVEGRWQIESR